MKFPGTQKQRRAVLNDLKKLLRLKNGDLLRVSGSIHTGVCSMLLLKHDFDAHSWVYESATTSQRKRLKSDNGYLTFIDCISHMTPIRRRLVKRLILVIEKEIEKEKKGVPNNLRGG